MATSVLPVISGGKKVGDLTLGYDVVVRPATISVLASSRDLSLSSTYSGFDYFYALRDLRIDLEKTGMFLACKGVLIDVYPSGMSADMSNGLVAYCINGDLMVQVNIFDVVPDDEFPNLSTVEAQKNKRKDFVRSGKSLRPRSH